MSDHDDDDDEDDMGTMSVPHPLLDADLIRVAEKFGQLAVEFKCVCVCVCVCVVCSVCVCVLCCV